MGKTLGNHKTWETQGEVSRDSTEGQGNTETLYIYTLYIVYIVYKQWVIRKVKTQGSRAGIN